MIDIKIDRCVPSSTQRCKSAYEIDDFINHLFVFSAEQENSLLINDYDLKPPIDQMLNFRAS